MWIEVAAIAFAGVFFIVGVLRIVEFSGLGLSKTKHHGLAALHIVGCALFVAALIEVATDLHETHRTIAFALFIAALLSLAPGQLTIAYCRRKAAEK